MKELKTKTDEVIIFELKEMVARERKLLTSILHYLKEVESRRLYLERGYPSLFVFVTEELGYSEGSAGRRIQAMRLIRDIPEVEEKIETGRISLTVASKVQNFLRAENKKRYEKDEEVLSVPEKLELINQLEGSSSRECEKKLIEISPETQIPKEKERPLTEDSTLIQFVADRELKYGIDKLKNLLSHQNQEHRLDELFKKLVELGLDKWDPERRDARRVKRKLKGEQCREESNVEVTPAQELNKKRRAIPAKIRDEIWKRDGGECQYKDPLTGKRCRAKHNLQIDHVVPVAMGGLNEPGNLRLLCREHNILHARHVYGEEFMDSMMFNSSSRPE